MKIFSFDNETAAGESLSFVKSLALYLLAKAEADGSWCETMDQLRKQLTEDKLLELCSVEPDYTQASVYQAEIIRQVVALFSKSTFLELGVDKEAAALKAFHDAEEACRKTNELFEKWHEGLVSFKPHLCAVYHRAQRKIARVLGTPPRLCDLRFRFGKGANRSVAKQRASVVEKLQARITCSEELYPYANRILDELESWREFHRDIRLAPFRVKVELSTGRVSFVLKSWKTHRAVDVPPSLNGLVQLAIGDDITRRMARFGLRIDDQTVNQSWAMRGSLTGEIATIDLTSASDMQAKMLVRSLFSFDWCLLLFPAAVSKTVVSGKVIEQQKFASMGNGFTFPIETLVFWALASSVKDEGWASVYGDDIVVRTEDYAAVIEVLEHAGFVPNKAKSFGSGDFRESCGKDFFRGMQIRPVYQKNLISCAELFRLHNFFYRKQWFDVCEYIKRDIPDALRIYGPDGYGDGHLLGGWKPYRKKSYTDRGFGGALFDTFILKGRFDKRRLRPGDRVLPAYSVYIREDGDTVLPSTDSVGLSNERFALKTRRYDSFQFRYPPEPLREENGVKAPSFPGVAGYKRICIYTFAVTGDV